MWRRERHRLEPRNQAARSPGLAPLPPGGGGAGGEGGRVPRPQLPPSPQPLSREGRGAGIRALRVWFLGRGVGAKASAFPPLPNPSPAGGEGPKCVRFGCGSWVGPCGAVGATELRPGTRPLGARALPPSPLAGEGLGERGVSAEASAFPPLPNPSSTKGEWLKLARIGCVLRVGGKPRPWHSPRTQLLSASADGPTANPISRRGPWLRADSRTRRTHLTPLRVLMRTHSALCSPP